MGWPYETLQGRLPHLNELPHSPGVPLLHASSFWDHSQLKYRAQNYPRLMLTCQKGKNGRETTENRQRIVLKRLVKRKWEARNIHQKREVSGQIKRVGISAWNLCWSALGVAQGETSAGLWWFCYHSCTSVALTTSKVLVTCVTTYRTDLRDNTRGLRNNQCVQSQHGICIFWVCTWDFNWQGWSKEFFGFGIFISRFFGDMKIWQVFTYRGGLFLWIKYNQRKYMLSFNAF